MSERTHCTPAHGDPYHCATCADTADRATIVSVRGGDADVVLDDGTTMTTAIDLIPDASPGDVILVHQGVAIARTRPEESKP